MSDMMKELRVWLEKEQGYSPKQKSPVTIKTLQWAIKRIERVDDLEDRVEKLIKQCNHLVPYTQADRKCLLLVRIDQSRRDRVQRDLESLHQGQITVQVYLSSLRIVGTCNVMS